MVKLLFGLDLPGVRRLYDMEKGFPDEFFDKIVFSETKRALEATRNPDKVIAWVSTGRNPHAGDPMPANDLERILAASHRAGLKRFIFHPDVNIGAAEWKVISRMCGRGVGKRNRTAIGRPTLRGPRHGTGEGRLRAN